MKNVKIFFVAIILILGFFVRYYKIDSPIADWHSHRQADTASVTRNYLNNGLDLLHPKYHDISNIQSGLENPQGYRMVELPIYNYFSIVTHNVLTFFNHNLTIEYSSRITSIIASLVAGLFLFLFSLKLTKSFFASILVLSVYLFLPFNIYYSRAILPESTANMFMVSAIYFFNINVVISGILFALAILVKPYTALIAFPLLAFYSYQKLSRGNFKINFLKLTSFAIISLAPFLLWRLWIQQYPEGIPVSAWLFNGGDMRFQPVWFRWLFYERIGKLILGTYGITAIILGLAYRKNHTQAISISSLFGILLYFSVIARGNIQHDYYQTLIMPFISLTMGFGFYYLLNFLYKSKILSIITAVGLAAFTVLFSGYQVKEYYNINNPNMIEAGIKAQEILPSNSLVIAPYNSDTAFLYQTSFPGWPMEIYDIPAVKTAHPNNSIYLVSQNYDNYTNSLMNKFTTLYKNEKFIILDLNHEIKK